MVKGDSHGLRARLSKVEERLLLVGKLIDVNDDRRLIMGEGVHFHIRDELWDSEKMRVHMDLYHPIGRMFADRYCRTDDRVAFPAAEGAKSK